MSNTHIVYTCPICGHDLRQVMITTNPPINRIECWSCGWYHEEEPEAVVRIPYTEKRENVVNLGNGFSISASGEVVNKNDINWNKLVQLERSQW